MKKKAPAQNRIRDLLCAGPFGYHYVGTQIHHCVTSLPPHYGYPSTHRFPFIPRLLLWRGVTIIFVNALAYLVSFCFFFLEQNTSTMEVMDTEGVFAEESEVDLTKETAVEEAVRTVDSEDDEDVQDDGGTLSSDDEDFIVGK